MTENSRWDLTDDEVGRHLTRAFDFIVDWLQHGEQSEPFKLDPSGDEPLRMAKRVRRAALRAGGEVRVWTEADRRFGLPPSALSYAASLREPLFEPLATSAPARRGSR